MKCAADCASVGSSCRADLSYGVWSGIDDGGSDSEIFLYYGMTKTHITNNHYRGDYPKISDNGHIVWYGWPGGYPGSDSEIFIAKPKRVPVSSMP